MKEKIDLTPIMLEFLKKTVNEYLQSDKDNDVEDFLHNLDEYNEEAIRFFHAKALIQHLGTQKAVTRAITGVSETTIWRKVDKK